MEEAIGGDGFVLSLQILLLGLSSSAICPRAFTCQPRYQVFEMADGYFFTDLLHTTGTTTLARMTRGDKVVGDGIKGVA